MSRQLTIAWAERNCPDQRVVRDVAKQLDEAERLDGHLVLHVGKSLTRSGTPYLVASLGRNMFAFELTERQARNLGMRPKVVGALVQRGTKDMFTTEPSVSLTELHVENASAQVGTQPVVGRFSYEAEEEILDGMALRMMYDLPSSSAVSHFAHFMGPLPGRGTLNFRMSPLGGSVGKVAGELPRTLLAIFHLCRQRAGGNAPDVPISDVSAALIDLA